MLRLYRHFGSLATAWVAEPEELAQVDGFGLTTARLAASGRSSLDPNALLHQHEELNPHFWTPADRLYPQLLLEIPDPPPVLYYRGQVNEQENWGMVPSVAIVGTRNPSEYGRRWTARITAALAEAGFTIVSGLAQGIDTIAHASCLQAQGRTVAVIATGVDGVYPYSNRRLSQQIAETGLLLSEYPAKTQPDRTHFPQRNRIIAGLSRATLVLEAPPKSGALITARVANEYGRDVYALPGSLDNFSSRGCLELIQQGGHPILGVEHLLDVLGTLPHLRPARSPVDQLSLFPAEPVPDLSPELQQILDAIPPDPIIVDLLIQRSGLATGDVLSALAQLELMGLVTQLPGMRYQR